MIPTLSDADLFARLVGFDTTSSNSNLPIVDFIEEYLDHPSIRTTRNPSPDGHKANVVAEIGPPAGESRDGLVLSGHMDVVPAVEPGWESDPFTLTAHDDRWVGRGAADMKGFLALAMNVAREAAGRQLEHPLVLLFTYDEEVGTLGARQFCQTWPREHLLPRRTIIGEPTSLRAKRMHKGHLKIRLSVRGVSAHSGYPHLGRNAIERAGEIVTLLTALRHDLEKEHPEHSRYFGEVPFATLNLATIEGGSAINIVPDSCSIEIGIRLLPGMRDDAMIERIRAVIGECDDCELNVISSSPPMLLDDETDLYREVSTMLGQSETESVSFATDAGWLQSLGMECLLFGPGAIEVAHRPNEFMPRPEMEQGAILLRRVVDRFCGSVG